MPHSQTKLFIRKKNAGSATKRPADWYLVGQGKNNPVSAKSLTSQQRGNIGTRAMQKTKIAAEELAEMIRDGLAEEGHDVQVPPILKLAGAWRSSPQITRRTPGKSGSHPAGLRRRYDWRSNINEGGSAALCFVVADRHRDRLPSGECRTRPEEMVACKGRSCLPLTAGMHRGIKPAPAQSRP